ncbi:stress response protein nst1-like [Rhagoletis pomonella]|uniref:stress response protein nst1-like n=1 Tax=Rhagoletis pomonella TaxID=28610 RepID=UPI00177CFF13|nr:stress response protein nst1-like [Rhagoletis pomonella]
MPRKRIEIGRTTASARKHKAKRAAETQEQRKARLEAERVRTALVRSSETEEQRQERLEKARLRAAERRAYERTDQREKRLQSSRIRMALSRAAKTEALQQKKARSPATEKHQEKRQQTNRRLRTTPGKSSKRK